MVRSIRKELEDFIFTDSNKISRNAIKFLLDKWTILETKLHEEIAEKEKWKAVVENMTKSTYLHVDRWGKIARNGLPKRTCNKKKTN